MSRPKKPIEAIKNYVVEKFPMLEGAVGNLFWQLRDTNVSFYNVFPLDY